ncbi:MAG: phosphatase PAP2 family protein [Gammaproteobacteria bacterium]|nr:phosphatase PAP2 family protein [Gammaproteobacteria bacterium]
MNTRVRWLALALGLALGAGACVLLVHADLALAAHFWRPGFGFYMDPRPPVQWIYRGLPWLVGGIAASLAIGLLMSLIGRSPEWRALRAPLAFLLLTLALGPGLLANGVFKDHWGRPRPYQLERFGGTMHYVPPGVPSTQCDRNCSFVCGHCAAAFWLIGLAWVDRRRRRLWLALGLTLGAGVSMVRMAQGGHFLSDALGALLVVWVTDALVYRGMRALGWKPSLN